VLSASRAQGMAAAGLVFSMTALPMITFFGERTNRISGFSIAAGIYSLLMILGYWYVYRITAGKDPYDETTGASSHSNEDRQSLGKTVKLVLANPPLLALIASNTFTNTGLFLVTAFAFYYMTYVLNDPDFLSVFILSMSVARFLGTIVAPWIGVRIGKRRAYYVFLALSAMGIAAARFIDSTPWSFTLIFCAAVVLGSVAGSMMTALFSDTVVYGEWKTAVNIRSFTMALMNLPIKLGVLIRSAIVTAGLIAIGYVANAAPTPRVVDGISSMMTLAPAAAYAIGAAVFYLGYRLDEKDVVRMQEDIQARKTEKIIYAT
jgi:Na+/melibiose symporter-like transporter